jgi:hypothetical protein
MHYYTHNQTHIPVHVISTGNHLHSQPIPTPARSSTTHTPHTNTHTHAYTHMHTHTHTKTHTHTHARTHTVANLMIAVAFKRASSCTNIYAITYSKT